MVRHGYADSMEDHDSPEAVTKRASQEDPIVMYLVVRESINMSIGKTAAQCAHASQMLQIKYEKLHKNLIYLRKAAQSGELAFSDHSDARAKLESIFEQWMASSFRKVVLKADEKEWAHLKEESTDRVIVVDAGLTELTPGTETVIGIWPLKKSLASKTLRRLQVLK